MARQLRGALLGLPDTEQADQEVLGEARVQHLADEEDVGGQSGLKHDGHVRGIEQADGVGATRTTLAGGLDGDLDAEALKVNDRSENDEGGKEVHDVGEVLAVESLLESTLLVGPGHQQVEQGDDGALVLGAAAGVDRGRGESLPHDRLADVGGDEEEIPLPRPYPFWRSSSRRMTIMPATTSWRMRRKTMPAPRSLGAVETGEDIDSGGTDGQDQGEELLSGLVELAIGLEVEVDVDHVGASKKLEDHAREMMGVIPSSISVPLLLASIIRSQ